MFFLLAAKKPLTAVVVTFILVDFVVASMLIASEFNNGNLLDEGVRFGFYKANDKTRG